MEPTSDDTLLTSFKKFNQATSASSLQLVKFFILRPIKLRTLSLTASNFDVSLRGLNKNYLWHNAEEK